MKINLVETFTATKHMERAALGSAIAGWLRERPLVEIIDRVVSQSSDDPKAR